MFRELPRSKLLSFATLNPKFPSSAEPLLGASSDIIRFAALLPLKHTIEGGRCEVKEMQSA